MPEHKAPRNKTIELNINYCYFMLLIFLPGDFRGQRSLVGCCPWGHTELDTTEAT